MANLPGHLEASSPVTSVHHRQHPWDVNFFDKIRGLSDILRASADLSQRLSVHTMTAPVTSELT